MCHGDIKAENVMITSWNWLLLTDFASFKPTYLPEVIGHKEILDQGLLIDVCLNFYLPTGNGNFEFFILSKYFYSVVFDLSLNQDFVPL